MIKLFTGGRATVAKAVVAFAVGAALAGCGAAAAPSVTSASGAGGHAASPARAATTTASNSAALSGFRVLSMTFVSDNQGWALGQTKCGSRHCLALLGTTDGGTHWQALTAPTKYAPTSAYPVCPKGNPCAGQVRFMTADIGYAFDPSLFITTDGGHTWTRLPGKSISSLEGADGTVARVISNSFGCSGQPYHVQSAAVGSDTWHNLNAPRILYICPPVLYREGERLVVVDYGNPAGGVRATARIDRSANDGKTWAEGPDKCGGKDGYASAVALAPPNVLITLCQHQVPKKNGKFGPAWIKISLNDGATYGPDHTLPAVQAPNGNIVRYQIAAGTRKRILVALTRPHGSSVLESQDGGLKWASSLNVTSTKPFIMVGFEDPLTARVAQGGTVWTTRNGGRTWHANKF